MVVDRADLEMVPDFGMERSLMRGRPVHRYSREERFKGVLMELLVGLLCKRRSRSERARKARKAYQINAG